MKLSCVPVSFFGEITSKQMSFGELANLAASLGLAAVDLSVALLEPRDTPYLRSIRAQIESAGIKIAGLMAYPDFVDPDPGRRVQQLASLVRDLDTANLLGAEFVRMTTGPNRPGTNRENGIKWAIDGLLRAAELAKRHGMKLLYEHHAKPSVWDSPDFNLPTEIFLKIAEALSETEIGILFDTANPLVYGDDPFRVLEAVFERVECVHISDIKTRGRQEMVVIGTGIVPISGILAFLKRSQYRGWISIEEASRTGQEGLERAVAFITQTWRAIRP
jgi:sugar phosphate isomerase/epimerase